MKRAITRRSALKKVAASTAGAAVAAALPEQGTRGAEETEFRVGNNKQAYESPSIAWRESSGPQPLTLSCAKQPGNPSCSTGPTTN